VPGFTITGELCPDTTGSTWAAVRTLDDLHLALKIIPVPDVTEGQALAAQMTAVLDRVGNQHLVRQHGSIALADGKLALVLDQVIGSSLDHLLGDRGHLTPGETVTTVAPLFAALADLHAAGVVHGDLTLGSVVFSVDGRPMISDLGVARLMGRTAQPAARTDGFVAPEVVGGAVPSSASDVYSMAALGWFCLLGVPPGPASTCPSLNTLSPGGLSPGTPTRLVEVLASCLSADPALRPSARAAAIEVFDAAPPESVVLTSAADPAAEITRRIRSTAASATVLPSQSSPSISKRLRRLSVVGAIALLVAVTIGAGTIWLRGRSPEAVHPVAVHQVVVQPNSVRSTSAGLAPAATVPPVAPATAPYGVTDVVTARDSPRLAAAGLLQALVDARALAYAARNPVLLDLVYAPGATKAGADRANLATALENGATYLGLAFVVKDAAFLAGTSTTARIRATIVTPAYKTGQPDGRKVPHLQEKVGPSVFTLSLTRDGWRILALTAP
jgi:eukaryotic-like serine/threonine-protein kinase